ECGCAGERANFSRRRYVFGGESGRFGCVAKNSKKSEIAVDTQSGRRLYTPHNEGGTPLAALEFALVSEIKRAA
ncbi:MAG: hypothetical protein KDJ63_16455, partial [Nitratireductor sp.]|nr:hypothetical protein [Nitratireductor sp.]